MNVYIYHLWEVVHTATERAVTGVWGTAPEKFGGFCVLRSLEKASETPFSLILDQLISNIFE